MSNLSRKMSHALRHAPEHYGLILDADGSVNLIDFVMAVAPGQYTQVFETVKNDPKGRFDLRGSRIRATQGHSVPVEPVLIPCPPPKFLYHVTKARNVEDILFEGLKPMKRTRVHLRERRHLPVIRPDETCLMVETYELQDLGMATNGVWLTSYVPQYLIA